MKEIIKFGLVIGVLLCVAIGAASAQEYSEDYKEGYKDGFYMSMAYVCSANIQGSELVSIYNSLNGQPTDDTVVVDNETMTWSDYYNEEATIFNEETVPAVNDVIVQIFGTDDNRTELLLLPELPIIT